MEIPLSAVTPLRFFPALLIPFVEINAAAPRLALSVDGKNSLDTFSFTQDSEGIEELVPALRSFFQVRSLRTSLQPRVEFHRHWRKKLTLVHSIAKMALERAAPRVPRRPDLDCRHGLADGVNDLPGNALRLFRARLGLFEAGVELLQALRLVVGRLPGARGRNSCVFDPSLLRRCHNKMVADKARP